MRALQCRRGGYVSLALRLRLRDDDPDRYPDHRHQGEGEHVEHVQGGAGEGLAKFQPERERDDELVGGDS